MTDRHVPQPPMLEGESARPAHTLNNATAQYQIPQNELSARPAYAVTTPPTVARTAILFLQRTLGNRHIAHQLHNVTSPHIQRVTHLNLDQIHKAVHTNPLVKQFRPHPIAVTVLIHDKAAYIKAYLEHAKSQGLAKTEADADKTEAFREKSNLHLRDDAGAEITDIHEYIHFLSDGEVRRWSEPLREAMTEYFARFVCTNASPPIPIASKEYETEHSILSALVNRAPDEVRLAMAKAYFNGSFMVFTNIVNTYTSGRAKEWFLFLEALKAVEANNLLKT